MHQVKSFSTIYKSNKCQTHFLSTPFCFLMKCEHRVSIYVCKKLFSLEKSILDCDEDQFWLCKLIAGEPKKNLSAEKKTWVHCRSLASLAFLQSFPIVSFRGPGLKLDFIHSEKKETKAKLLNLWGGSVSLAKRFRFYSWIYFKSVCGFSYCIWVAKHNFPFKNLAARDIRSDFDFKNKTIGSSNN